MIEKLSDTIFFNAVMGNNTLEISKINYNKSAQQKF